MARLLQSSDKIASHYSPRASHLSVNTVSSERSRVVPPQFARAPGTLAQPGGAAMTEPSDESVAELTPDQMQKYMELLASVDNDAIAPIKQEWIERVRRAPRSPPPCD